METRTITQVRMYKLILNPMTDRCEASALVAMSDDYNRLVSWYMDQLADVPWRDGDWYKTFKSGSSIEWCNPCHSLELNYADLYGHGISEEWVSMDVYNNVRNNPLFV